ncbi:MAG: Maf family nucleotide pyrophosphatase [Desulfovibrionaceae bacterium]
MFSPFQALCPLVLASSSPRRQEFLRDMGLAFTCVCPLGSEPAPLPGEDPAVYAQRAADGKSLTVAKAQPDAVVIGADTVVALEHRIFGKPRNAAHALHMLKALCGCTHTVISALCVVFPARNQNPQKIIRLHRATAVTFHAWPENLLAAYVATGEPMDKAGAYAIQGQGAFLVESIHGSWSSVVGLPLTELLQLLWEENSIGTATLPALKML